MEEVCKGLDVSPATYHCRSREFGGTAPRTVRESLTLIKENARPKLLIAKLSLNNRH